MVSFRVRTISSDIGRYLRVGNTRWVEVGLTFGLQVTRDRFSRDQRKDGMRFEADKVLAARLETAAGL